MGKITILIFSMDQDYGNALGKAISNLHRNFSVHVRDFKEAETKKSYLVIQAMETEYKVLLSDEPVAIRLDKLPEQIYKYERVSEISKEIGYIVAMMTGKRWVSFSRKKTKIIGFYGASGGCGKTSLTIGVAKQLSRYENQKVLYLSLEEFESTQTYFTEHFQENGRNISHYLYYAFHREKESVASFAESFMGTDSYGVDFFKPCGSHNELTTLNCEELYKFFNGLMKYGIYNYILLDFQSMARDETMYLMTCCEKMVLIQEASFLSKMKTEKFISYVCKEQENFSEENLIRVKNKVKPFDFEKETQEITVNTAAEEKEDSLFVSVAWDEDSFTKQGQGVHISVENTFGLGVQTIVAKIRAGREKKLQRDSLD